MKMKMNSDQKQEQAKPKEYKVSILTPYLTEGLEQFECPFDAIENIALFGYDPINLNGLKFLQTDKKNIVTINSPEYKGQKRYSVRFNEIRDSDLAITGATEPSEDEVRSFRGSGLVVARFSIFYRNRNGYTNSTPEDAGYSLDLPKAVGCAVALITNDNFLEALVSREEARIRDAVADLNKGKESAPILITPYLSQALKIPRQERGMQ